MTAKPFLRRALAACLALAAPGIGHAAAAPADLPGGAGLRYFEFFSEAGDKMKSGRDGCVHASYTLSRARASVSESAPAQRSIEGAPTARECAELAGLVRGMTASSWAGRIEGADYWALRRERKGDRCWRFHAVFDPAGKGAGTTSVTFVGCSAGRAVSEPNEKALQAFFRRFYERELAEHPGEPVSLSAGGPDGRGGWASYSLRRCDNEEAGLWRLYWREGGARAEGYVDPALVRDFGERVKALGIEGWHGFSSGDVNESPKTRFSFQVRYSNGREVSAMGDARLAGGKPERYDAVVSEVSRWLKALAGPAADKPAAPQFALSWGVSGMSSDSSRSWKVYSRIGRAGWEQVLRCRRGEGKRASVKEKPLSEAEVARIEALVRELGLLAWDGFSESARGVMDGSQFGFSVRLRDGSGARASGSNRWPEGYRGKSSRLAGLLEELLGSAGQQD
ncbi:MAG: hypothetical protein HUK26_08885 [Duodenibacillus sp.]|nr:hypothetical protein [Duodenibacillus sp.]